MFAFIEHGQPHNHHGGENTITLSHASVRRPCQKLTKSLTSQVRASENISTLGRRSLRPSQRHQNPTLQIVAVKYGLHDQISQKTVRISPQLRRGLGSRHVYENGSGPKRKQSHSSILWSGRREVQGFASQILVSLRAFGPCVLRWKMLTHFLSSAPWRVRFPSPGA